MILTFFVYISIFVVMLIIALEYKQSKSKYASLWLFVGGVIYSVIIGLRYDVGIDYMSYKNWFEKGEIAREVETEWLTSTLHSLGLNFTSFFFCMAAVQIMFFLFSFKERKQVIIWGVFFFFVTLEFFLSMNVIRQTAAWCIFLYSIKFIYHRKALYYCICIFFASMFHRSALALLPFYFLPNMIHAKRQIFYAFYFLTFIIGVSLQSVASDFFGRVAIFMGYDNYGDQISIIMKTIVFAKEDSLGLAKTFWFIIDCTVLYHVPKMLITYNKQGYGVIFILFFIGIVLNNIVGGTILDRVTMYFLPFNIVVYSFLFKYLLSLKDVKAKLFVYSMTSAMIFFYIYSGIIGNASGCTPFRFV